MICNLGTALALMIAFGPGCAFDEAGDDLGDRNLDGFAPHDRVDDKAPGTGDTEAGNVPLSDHRPMIPSPQPLPPQVIGLADNPTSLALTDDGVYWTDAATSDSELSRVLRRDDNGTTVLASYHGFPVGLVAHGDRLYWADAERDSILSMPLAGGPITAVVSGLGAPYALATDGRRLYWTDVELRSIWSHDLVTRSVDILARDQGVPAAIVVTSNALIWSDVQSGSIRAIAKTGGDVTTLVTDRPLSTGLAVDDDHVYFSDLAASTVERVSLADGSVEVLTYEHVGAWSLALYGDTLAFGGRANSAIVTMHKDGGPIRVLAEDQSYPDYLVARGGILYWASISDGAIWMAGLRH